MAFQSASLTRLDDFAGQIEDGEVHKIKTWQTHSVFKKRAHICRPPPEYEITVSHHFRISTLGIAARGRKNMISGRENRIANAPDEVPRGFVFSSLKESVAHNQDACHRKSDDWPSHLAALGQQPHVCICFSWISRLARRGFPEKSCLRGRRFPRSGTKPLSEFWR
jgi:hypothetical protein